MISKSIIYVFNLLIQKIYFACESKKKGKLNPYYAIENNKIVKGLEVKSDLSEKLVY
tara:strand:- start:5149 stop:5319 length:171 start_codon:yes stop_codon:yes gene_type:complete